MWYFLHATSILRLLALASLLLGFSIMFLFIFVTHQPHDVPGVTAAEGLAEGEREEDHGEDDEGAEVGPQVLLHRLFHNAGEGENANYREGEQQLESQEAKHLQEKNNQKYLFMGTKVDKSKNRKTRIQFILLPMTGLNLLKIKIRLRV